MGGIGYARASVAVAATLWLMITAREVLEPFLVALFVWFLVSATARIYGRWLARLGLGGPLLGRIASAVTILASLAVLSVMVSDSAARLAGRLPHYEARLDGLAGSVAAALGVEQAPAVGELLDRIDLGQAALDLLGTAASAVTAFIVILVYTIFIGQEAGAFRSKLAALFPDEARREEVRGLVADILREIETYVGIKVLLGLVQALPTWAVLALLGVDAPAFWAVLIFLFSFVPTIGTMVGIVFPALMALVQFDTLTPFLVTVATLLPVQLAASNFLEPRLMGSSLNLSPLVVFLGIFAGGALWGIVGALVIVPVLATAVIVFARVPALRPVAILLTADGRVPGG